jgi:hypothetical protein
MLPVLREAFFINKPKRYYTIGERSVSGPVKYSRKPLAFTDNPLSSGRLRSFFRFGPPMGSIMVASKALILIAVKIVIIIQNINMHA